MNNLKKFIILSLSVFILLPTFSALGQTTNLFTPAPNVGKFKDANSLLGLVGKIARYIYFALFAIAVIFLLMAAFSYLTSGGDPGKVKKASAQLIYAIVAIIVGILAFSITAVIENLITR